MESVLLSMCWRSKVFSGMGLSGLLLHGGVVLAQVPPEERGAGESRQLETVTVRARRSIEQRFFAAGSMVTVDRQDIEQMGADSVADVLRQLPGVQVIGAGNGSVEVRMRGMERSATHILIDGERVSDSRQSGQLSFDQLPADLIERIEVLRAPTAEHAGATGGTINIILRQPTVKSETNLRLTEQRVWGQNALQGFFSKTGPLTAPPPEGDVVARQPWTYFLAGGAAERMTGSDIHRHNSVTGSNPVVTDSDEKYRIRTSEWFLIPRASGRLGPADQINLRSMLVGTHARGAFDSTGAGADGFGPVSSRVFDQSRRDRSMLQLRGDWTHSFKGSRLESFLSGQSNREKIDRNREQTLNSSLGSTAPAASSFTPSTFAEDSHERVMTASTKLMSTDSPLLWMTGAEAEERRLDLDTASSAGLNAVPQAFGLNARIRRQVLWGQNEWELPAAWPWMGELPTTLTAGLRLESVETRSSYSGMVITDRRQFLQPSLHTRTPLSEELQLRFNLARVSRNPTLIDLVDRRVPSQGLNTANNPDFAGNPGLRPESAVTLDGGFERKLGPQSLMGANLFVRQMKDVIARRVSDNGAGLWTQRPENVGNATVWGLETDVKTSFDLPARWGWGKDWTLSGTASLLQSRMTSGDSIGQRIPGQARYLMNLNVAKPMPQTGGWFGGGTLSFTGAADLNTSPTATGRELAYNSVDMYLGQVVSGFGYWRLTVYNLTNSRRSRERVDMDTQGRRYSEQSTLLWTPRVFLTVGTRF